MWEKIVSVAGGCVTIIGLIGLWIKIGRDQGNNERRLKDVEDKSAEHEKDIAEIDTRIDSVEKDFSGFKNKLSTDIDWIKDSLKDIKNDITDLKKGKEK